MSRLVRWVTVACCAAATACGSSTAPSAGSGREARTTRQAASVTLAADPGAAPYPALPVDDLRTGTLPQGSTPHGFVPVSATRAFFVADDGAAGNELWVTDGTGAGTSRVADLRPGAASALPGPGTRFEAVAFQGGLLFAADDGARGTELWFSDGTGAGTRLVKDIAPGTAASSPRGFTVVGATAFFAVTGVNGTAELWRTDGTAAGTKLVRDIGLGDADPVAMIAYGSTLVFGGRVTPDGTPGLWVSTAGTAATTGPVKSLRTLPSSLTLFQGKVLFAAAPAGTATDVVLWSSDGSAGGTAALANSSPAATDPALLTPLGTDLFYAATVGTARHLFRTDGVSQIRIFSSETVTPAAMATAGGKLFVAALRSSTSVGTELYLYGSSPIPALTLLADATPGAGSSNPTSLTPVGSSLLYVASDLASSASLWKSDGTPDGTSRIFASNGPDAGEIATLGTVAFLAAADGNGSELWRSDTSPAGTSLVLNLHPDFAGSFPSSLTGLGGRLFFAADGEVGGTPVGRELWTASGPGATLVQNIYVDAIVPGSSSPADLVAAGPRLLFTATDPVSGRELWATDGASLATALVKDIDPGTSVQGGITVPRSGVQSPAWLTRHGASVLFAADDGSGAGRELWITDGTGPGTQRLVDLNPGAQGSFPTDLTEAGGLVWFLADDGVPLTLSDSTQLSATKIYRTDGTAPGTLAATNLNCDPTQGPVWAPPPGAQWFAELNGATIFAAASDFYLGEVKPFRWDGSCVRNVLDTSFFDTVDPSLFTVVGGVGWFAARDFDGAVLFRTDGFPSVCPGGVCPPTAPTRPVLRFGTQGGGRIGAIAGLGGLLFLVANDEQHGDELWTFDPATGAAALVMDAYPGAVGAAEGSTLLPVPLRGRVIYAADDGVHGRELWISDGTPAGTRMLQDLRPGPESSNPDDFTMVGPLVYFTADDGQTGRELWVLDTSEGALDLTPPVPLCPAGPFFAEASRPDGGDPVFAITATDNFPDPVTFSYVPAPGATPVRFGESLPVTATATDRTGNSASCQFLVQVRDTTGPALTCPPDLHAEATSPAGAAVSYQATAFDLVSLGNNVIGYSIAPGSVFALGAGFQPLGTPVTVTATDERGNPSTCLFTVNVADTTPPAITCPAPDPVEATSYIGAVATWADVGVSDLVTPAASIVVSYDRARGDVYPIGATPVTATAIDWVGNAGTCTFPVRVQDTKGPAITCPFASATFEADSPAGYLLGFAATATDVGSPTVELFYADIPGTFASGELVPIQVPLQLPGDPATHFLVASARDGFGNVSSCNSLVRVKDTTPPFVTCLVGQVLAEASGPAGALVSVDGNAFALDAATAVPVVTFSPPSGLFPLQASKLPTPTAVVASSTDASGNTGVCSFEVVVRDTTPPAATRLCGVGVYEPPPVEATGPDGAVVEQPLDFVDAVTTAADLLYTWVDQGTGAPIARVELQPLGARIVDAVAVDEAGNASLACTHVSRVVDTTPPSGVVCPADLVVEAVDPTGADASWTDVSGVDVVTTTALLAIRYEDAATGAPVTNGGRFPVATTTVRASVTDLAGNATTCTFSVAVRDRTAPAIACAPVDPLEATEPRGAAVTFGAVATDAVTPVPAITYATPGGSVSPGDFLPVGTTIVTATAADAAGNLSTCDIAVIVRDTIAPTIGCAAPEPVEATSNGAAHVTFDVTAADSVTVPPELVYTTAADAFVHSGDPFPVGTTDVTATARDAAGNSARCQFQVVVTDTTPPAMVCPDARTVTASGPVPVTFPPPTVVDYGSFPGSPPVIQSSKQSGDTFPMGQTVVTFTATDASGNVSYCTMAVTVQLPPPPAKASGCGCGSGSGSGGAVALFGLVLAVVRPRRLRRAAAPGDSPGLTHTHGLI
jgi:ELWxxDGT repeat protein